MGHLAHVLEKAVSGILGTRPSKVQGKDESIRGGLDTETGLKLRRAEKVVNEYGIALEKASYLNRFEVENLVESVAEGKYPLDEVCESLRQGRGRHHDLLTLKFSASLLPYPKDKIKEAIELLLRYDSDPENIRLLREGLRYLESFV